MEPKLQVIILVRKTKAVESSGGNQDLHERFQCVYESPPQMSRVSVAVAILSIRIEWKQIYDVLE